MPPSATSTASREIEVPVHNVNQVHEQSASLPAGGEIPVREAVEVTLGVPRNFGKPSEGRIPIQALGFGLHAGRRLFQVTAVGVPKRAHHVDLADGAGVDEFLFGLDKMCHGALDR